jgi:hypothetical protein
MHLDRLGTRQFKFGESVAQGIAQCPMANVGVVGSIGREAYRVGFVFILIYGAGAPLTPTTCT